MKNKKSMKKILCVLGALCGFKKRGKPLRTRRAQRKKEEKTL
jgi:hypothetical protein